MLLLRVPGFILLLWLALPTSESSILLLNLHKAPALTSEQTAAAVHDVIALQWFATVLLLEAAFLQ